jgi:hypothetical protein
MATWSAPFALVISESLLFDRRILEVGRPLSLMGIQLEEELSGLIFKGLSFLTKDILSDGIEILVYVPFVLINSIPALTSISAGACSP